jgi:hypothetical protein
MSNKNSILKALLKDFSTKHTITSLSKSAGMTRVGIWKLLKNLELEKFVKLTPVGKGKTSVYTVTLNWENSLVEKMLSIILTEEALKNQRWINNFSELEKNVYFLIIYGSTLNSFKEANDIDLIGIVSKKSNFRNIELILSKIQKTQLKKIHSLNFTETEFKNELKKPNKAFIDALNKGIILFGQENFVNFIKGMSYGR